MAIEAFDLVHYLDLISNCSEEAANERLASLDIYEGVAEQDISYLLTGLYNRGKLSRIKILIDNGLNINARNYNYGSVLDYALFKSNLEDVRTLIEWGANPFQVDDNGNCKLFQALRYKNNISRELLLYLMELGLNPYNNPVCLQVENYTLDTGELITIEWLKAKSQFTDSTNDYKKYFRLGSYEIALDIVKNELNNVGPIIQGIQLTKHIEGLLADYRALLYLTGNLEEERVVAKFLDDSHNLNYYFNRDIRINLATFSLFTGDTNKFKEYTKSLRKMNESDSIVTMIFLLEQMHAKITNASAKDKAVITRSFNQYKIKHVRSNIAKLITDVVLSNGISDKFEELIENQRQGSNSYMRTINSYILYCINNERYLDAKYAAMKLTQCELRECSWGEYVLNVMLNRYVEQLENNE